MKKVGFAAFLAAVSFTISGPAFANDYPAKAVTIVVPFAAGGTNDIIARAVGTKLAERLGQPFIVENRAGAGGNVGAKAVAQAKPDGYTLMTANVGILTTNRWLYANVGYDPISDLAPITMVGKVPNVLLVNSSIPVNTVAELLAYAKARPGAVTFASMGTGTTGHLCGEMLRVLAGIDVRHVAYRGSAPALNDLLGGHVNIMFDNLPTALPLVQSGQVKALAVTSAERSELLPNVPTMIESGVAGFDATAWFGFVAPAGTPAPVLDRLNTEMVKVLVEPEMRERLKQQGVNVVANNRVAFTDDIASESRKWKDIVDRSGVKAE